MRLGLSLLMLGAMSCVQAWQWDLPLGVEPPRVPADNPMDEEKIALGRALFFDEALSSSGDIACASCHDEERAFTEDREVSRAQGDVLHTRNAPTLINSAWSASYGFDNRAVRTLERHAPVPLFGEDPVEIGLNDEGLAYLDREYGATLEDLVHGLASFQRSLISFDSAWDRGALSAEELRGEDVFIDRGCVECHAPPFFTRAAEELFFADNGLSAGELLKPPSLRFVGVTGPYLHDGRVATLEEIVELYNEAHELQLDDTERVALLAFLRAL